MGDRDGTSIGDRFKRYERAYETHLPWRLPVIVRVDGRAFHTWARHFNKPFDDRFRWAMGQVMNDLCSEMPGAKFAYSQSDEVSVLLTNDDTLATEPWFNNDLCKLCSVSASIATATMNRLYPEQRYAHFDGRAFVVPPDDVVNYFVWRQRDWTRNSIQMAARALFSAKELHGIKTNELQEKMWKEKGVNWNDYPTKHKRGIAMYRDVDRWVLDEEPPIFTADRDYIERHYERRQTVETA